MFINTILLFVITCESNPYFPSYHFSPLPRLHSFHLTILEHITTFDQVNPRDVFVNNEVKLSKIQVYGFDYDYTLAHYTSALDEFIFNESRNWLVEQMKVS